MTAFLEFDGPPNWHCLGRPYVTLTSVGIKREAHPYPDAGHDTVPAAWLAFETQLSVYKRGAEQIAWRTKPEAEQIGGKWFVRSRLVAFP